MNRKGNVIQIFILLSIILGIIFVSMLSLKFLRSFSNAVGDTLGNEANENLEKGAQSFSFMDGAIVIFIVILGILFILSALYIPTNPAYFFISAFLLIIVVIGSSSISNVIGTISDTESLVNETATFDKSITIGKNLPLFTTIIGMGFMLVLYGVWRGGYY